MIRDTCPDDAPGAREISFRVPERFNAASVLFDNLARGNGARPAIHHDGGALSYAALCAAASRFGHGLLALGLRRSERVLLLLDDTPAMPIAFFGAIRAGLVPVCINTLTPPELLNFYLAHTEARVAVIEGALADQALSEQATAGTNLAHVIIASGEAASDRVAVTTLEAFSAPHPDQLDAADTHRDDMAFWLYSSGSTGRPKGIVHLQHDIAYTVASYADRILKLTPDDICFSVPKIFFAYGLGNSLSFPFAAGASSVLLAGRPDPARVFAAIGKHRPTVFFGLPTLYTALCHAPEAEHADTRSLRLCISAAEVLSEEVAALWKRRTGLDIIEGLGSTEVLHIYLSNAPEGHRPGAAGRRVPGYEVVLRDPDGREVGDGQEGILWVRGHSNAPGYWNRPDKTAETMREGGWIYTGDRFLCDAEGFHYFRGRADDLVKVSGQWVHPMEVELCLANHPAVKEVAVLALELPDRRMTLKAWVVAKEEADPITLPAALQDHAKRALLPYKYPRVVELVAELPKTGTGKIDRVALKARG
ncbi:benzoate-CoA ligase family protein [Falsiroseomonas bella]|uniref:Benzoate-CoA ligase family protein n=1 Tax=Falsiroseomonas bella TaxID=2184016 RepID=A0A317FAW4_9PROT|nr:benzoate-CoA ligase family protein [Falsiroseomonas bella]PWS36281.1 benzoate-CoA ligase family protein [Falsiroseomonas bella]